MFALILTLCIAPVNAMGIPTGPDNCEDAILDRLPTMKQCVMQMDKRIAKIKRSDFYDFDWMVSCEEEEK